MPGLDTLEYKLEQYREIRLGPNLVSVPPDRIAGDIEISIEESAQSTLTFTLWNDDDAIPGIYKPPTSPRDKAISMIGQKVQFIGGYKGKGMHRRLFNGIIYSSNPTYADNGRVSLTIEAKSRGYQLGSVSRHETYPVSGRENKPTKDGAGLKARNPDTGDNKHWSVVKKGGVLKLSDVIRNLVTDAGLEIGNIEVGVKDSDGKLVREPTFDGKRNVLHQEDLTDWQFLQLLCEKYQLKMWIDEETEKFNIVHYEQLATEATKKVSAIDDRGVSGVHFYYHRLNPIKPQHITPIQFMKPHEPNCALPMTGISVQIDIDNIHGGFVQQHTDVDGNLVMTSVVSDNDGKLGYERLTLRKELLAGPQADAFIKNFQLGKTGWEETKKFWKTADVKIIDSSDTRNNPPFYTGHQLEFETLGCIFIKPFSSYYVYNLGFGVESGTRLDRKKCNVVGLTHKFGNTFRTSIQMRLW